MEALNRFVESNEIETSPESLEEMNYNLNPVAVKALTFLRNCKPDNSFALENSKAYKSFYCNRFCINYVELYKCYYLV